MRAIDKYFLELIDSYRNLFANGYQIDRNYDKALSGRISGVKKKIQHTR